MHRIGLIPQVRMDWLPGKHAYDGLGRFNTIHFKVVKSLVDFKLQSFASFTSPTWEGDKPQEEEPEGSMQTIIYIFSHPFFQYIIPISAYFLQKTVTWDLFKSAYQPILPAFIHCYKRSLNWFPGLNPWFACCNVSASSRNKKGKVGSSLTFALFIYRFTQIWGSSHNALENQWHTHTHTFLTELWSFKFLFSFAEWNLRRRLGRTITNFSIDPHVLFDPWIL